MPSQGRTALMTPMVPALAPRSSRKMDTSGKEAHHTWFLGEGWREARMARWI